LPRKTYDHGFASREVNAMARPAKRKRFAARTTSLGTALAHAYSPMRSRLCVFDKVQQRETMTT